MFPTFLILLWSVLSSSLFTSIRRSSYADNIIAIEDEGDGIIYYFSTENALAAGEDASITVGDRVQITYQGGLGDEEHPGRAVKIETAFQ